jgi:chemotaxis protein methyltransferase CheR
MAARSDDLGLSSTALPLVRDLIHERLGLYYGDDRIDMLLDRLSPLVIQRGFESFLDYYYLLKYDEESAEQWLRVADALSVPETYFWREMDQVRAIVDHVVPAIVEAQPSRPLRIWSVPCATGEEPLTIAMLLEERGWFDRARIEIHASDASPAALARAAAGLYRERSFRSLPVELRDKYFIRSGDSWTVRPSLHRRVTSWSRVNLLCEGEAAPRACVPIIFCRNVFIYFSPRRVKQVVEQFARAMPRPAFLCVGAAESLLKIDSQFDLEEIGGAFVYVKR